MGKPLFQPKHYQVIADIIHRLSYTERNSLAYKFADALARLDPKFRRYKFIRVCYSGGKYEDIPIQQLEPTTDR